LKRVGHSVVASEHDYNAGEATVGLESSVAGDESANLVVVVMDPCDSCPWNADALMEELQLDQNGISIGVRALSREQMTRLQTSINAESRRTQNREIRSEIEATGVIEPGEIGVDGRAEDIVISCVARVMEGWDRVETREQMAPQILLGENACRGVPELPAERGNLLPHEGKNPV